MPNKFRNQTPINAKSATGTTIATYLSSLTAGVSVFVPGIAWTGAGLKLVFAVVVGGLGVVGLLVVDGVAGGGFAACFGVAGAATVLAGQLVCPICREELFQISLMVNVAAVTSALKAIGLLK